MDAEAFSQLFNAAEDRASRLARDGRVDEYLRPRGIDWQRLYTRLEHLDRDFEAVEVVALDQKKAEANHAVLLMDSTRRVYLAETPGDSVRVSFFGCVFGESFAEQSSLVGNPEYGQDRYTTLVVFTFEHKRLGAGQAVVVGDDERVRALRSLFEEWTGEEDGS